MFRGHDGLRGEWGLERTGLIMSRDESPHGMFALNLGARTHNISKWASFGAGISSWKGPSVPISRRLREY